MGVRFQTVLQIRAGMEESVGSLLLVCRTFLRHTQTYAGRITLFRKIRLELQSKASL